MINKLNISSLAIMLIIIQCTTSGCGEDTVMEEIREMEEEEEETLLCPRSITPDTFLLTAETLAKFPYGLEEATGPTYFVDSTGNRVLANFPEMPSLFAGRIFPNTVQCIADTTQEIIINGRYQRIGTEIDITELGLRFTLNYRVWHNIDRYEDRIFREIGGIYVTNSLDAEDPYFLRPIPQLALTINDNNWPSEATNPALPADEILLNSKLYYNVFTSNVGTDKFLIYYSFELGLIGFKDKRDGILYTLMG
jgi:hypothetical protein